MNPRRKRRLVVVALSLVTLVGVLVGLQRKLLFPTWAMRAEEAPEVPGREQLWLSIGDGRVEAWFLPGQGVSAKRPGPLVIFAHGNGELIDYWAQVLDHYRDRGVSVLLAEYRGYGRSGGSPSQQGIVRDYAAFYDQVVSRPEVDASRVILHGRSLGGGVVCALSTQRPAAAIILQSTFTSVSDLASEKYFVPRFLIRDPFDNESALRAFKGPVLIVHGEDDELIPTIHATKLHAAKPDSKLLLMPGGHNDTPRSWESLWKQVDRFLVEASVLDESDLGD